MDWEERLQRREERRQRRQDGRGEGKLVMGLIVVGLGIIFLLQNIGVLQVYNIWEFWPVIVIMLGLARIANSYTLSGRTAGGIMVLVGGIFLASNLGYIPWDIWRLFWPLLLILWGVAILFRGIERRNSSNPGSRPNWEMWPRPFTPSPDANVSNTIHTWAIFGGSRRRLDTQQFEGGEVLAVFGGVRVDLRNAGSTRDEVYLEANALFGGVDIRVPENWTVTMRGMGIFGGYEDRTRSSENGFQPGKPNLVVTGVATFGGVTVKN
jgi:predicted membrane protein